MMQFAYIASDHEVFKHCRQLSSDAVEEALRYGTRFFENESVVTAPLRDERISTENAA